MPMKVIPMTKKKLSRRKTAKKSGFLQLNQSYVCVVKDQERLPYEDRLQDWIHVKQSSNGLNSRKRKVMLVSPATGAFVRI